MSTEMSASNTGLAGDEGRQYGGLYMDPLVYYLGWFLLAYFGLFVTTVYVGPALFGTRPFAPGFYHPYGSNYRKRRSVLENLDLVELTKSVVSSLEKFGQP